MAKFASERRALGECDRCGFTYLLRELRYEYYDLKRTNFRVCPSCLSPDHPQLQVGKRPVVDAEALRDPRPDRRQADLTNIRWGWRPVFSLEAVGHVGLVAVEIRAVQPTPTPAPAPSPSPDEFDLVSEQAIDSLHQTLRALADPTYW